LCCPAEYIAGQLSTSSFAPVSPGAPLFWPAEVGAVAHTIHIYNVAHFGGLEHHAWIFEGYVSKGNNTN